MEEARGKSMLNLLKFLFDNIKKSYTIYLSKSDSDLLKKKCRTMMVTEEEYIANVVTINVRPNDGGFRILTRGGLPIDSKGKSIDEYMDEQLSD